MNTLIFAETKEQAQTFRDENFLYGAEIVMDAHQLEHRDLAELHLVGDYELNPEWPYVLRTLRLFRTQFHVVAYHCSQGEV